MTRAPIQYIDTDGNYRNVDLDELRGPAGPPGSGGSSRSQYLQSLPASTWTFAYAGEFPPNVMIIDSTGDVIEPDIEINIATKTFTVTFGGPVSGLALLS